MSRTTKFYEAAERFQNKRAEIMNVYEKRVNDLKKHEGSQYHTEEMQKAEQTRDDALKALQDEYSSVLYSHVEGMRKANEARALTPPTEEELRLVQALKLRSSVSQEELHRAANALRGSEVCLSVLQEIANDMVRGQTDANGIPRVAESYLKYATTKEMPIEQTSKIIKSIEGSLKDFIEFDTNLAARRAAEYHANLYGMSGDERPLPKRTLFNSKQSAFKELVGLSGEELERFSAAVDGEA